MKFDAYQLTKIPILDVAIELGIDVKNNKAMCFNGHDSKTPSLSFTPQKNLWHCFGCGEGGNNINLVQQHQGLPFLDACSLLSDIFGISSADGKTPDFKKRKAKVFVRKQTVRSNEDENRANLEVYEWLFKTSNLSPTSLSYLTNTRGFSEKTIEHFNVKCIDKPVQKFQEAVAVWGIEILLNCGLAKQEPGGNAKFIWWKPTIMFPFYNENGAIIYIQGRQHNTEDYRYINLKGVRKEIFHLNLLSKLPKGSSVYICEGITDVITAHEHGLNAVGILGASSFREDMARHFLDHEVGIIPDADSAGRKFATSIEKAFMKYGKVVQIVNLPEGQDLSDFVKH